MLREHCAIEFFIPGRWTRIESIERWKTVLQKTAIAQVESVIGNLLRETEYELASTQDEIRAATRVAGEVHGFHLSNLF